jgi:predicted lipoprotein with Yx(FWY)xxD motif
MSPPRREVPLMKSRLLMIALVVIAAIAVMACSSGTGAATASPAAPSVAASQAAPSVAASEAAPSEAPSAATGGATVEAKEVGTAGTILVDGASGMTVYLFTKDTKDSGTSACTGGCLDTWPALTVPAGGTPTGGSGVTGTLGTITRADDGSLQVTYNGLPLYFFKNDKAPGDLNGVYENWETVKP